MSFVRFGSGKKKRFGRYPVRKKSKAEQALAKARKNERKLSTAVEVVQATAVTSTDAFNSTPRVDLITLSGDGLKTMIKSVQVKGTIKQDLASTAADDWRVDLVLDREPNGTEVTPLLFYGTATPTIGAFKNIIYKKRFKILRTESGIFNENTVVGHIINWYVRLNLIAETKTVNSWTQSNMTKNALYLIYWTTAGANQPVPAFQSRAICQDSNA